MLTAEDFRPFFEEIHGYDPFPWQERLLHQVVEHGRWPAGLDLPTGSGKTAAIDVALFHLALEADRGQERRAPVRIVFVVDRRLVVDDAFARAHALEKSLADATGPVTRAVAKRLQALAGDGPPMLARRLRGGIPREDDWARTPSQPTVLCSTVDQVGSRLLFRGYGVSNSMKPVHAGLLGSDCLILLDEAHLSAPFRQTLDWVALYRGERWREVAACGRWGVSLLTATPGDGAERFPLKEEDRRHPVLRRRLEVVKPVHLSVKAVSNKGGRQVAETQRAQAIADEVGAVLDRFRKRGTTGAPAIGVVVNRVARARRVHEMLSERHATEIRQGAMEEPVLLIGPARPLDRDELAGRLAPLRTRPWKEGEHRALERATIVVATQCIEVGVDIDLDALVTEAAPLDSLRQRFGRVNRAGREVDAHGSVIAWKPELSTRYDDPIYGAAVREAWGRLQVVAKQSEEDSVDFGIDGWTVPMDDEALAPKEDAPVLLPAHVDLLSETSPVPVCTPEVGLFLHGPQRQPDAISVVWRADVDPTEQSDDRTRRLLTLVPPRSTEAVQLPVWAVRRWLQEREPDDEPLGDVAARVPEDESEPDSKRSRSSFRWRGDEDASAWIDAGELRPGDTIVVPARYGGLDRFGWKPGHRGAVDDIGQPAGDAYASRRYAVRVATGLCGDVGPERLAEALASAATRRWDDVRVALARLPLPDLLQDALGRLDEARGKKVVCHLEAYGADAQGRPRGAVFVALLGIATAAGDDGAGTSTEDDVVGSTPGYPLALDVHNKDVARQAGRFAEACGLPEERVADLALAGTLHDSGKADPRFQAWLYHGDPLGPDESRPEAILAKSGRRLPLEARRKAGLPDRWRHEAASVRRARTHDALREANDADLVLWLIGVHHGYGRPLYPHDDPEELEGSDAPGPQSPAFDWHGADWATLFERLKARYGTWELARMEAILRLADHRASARRAPEMVSAKQASEKAPSGRGAE